MTGNEFSRLGSEEAVERLVKLADGGVVIPPDGAARVKLAVRPAWERTVRRRRMRRASLIVAAAAALAIVIAALLSRSPVQPLAPAGHLQLVKGSVLLLDTAGATLPVVAGSPLPAASTLRTDDSSYAALRLGNRYDVRVDAGSSVRFDSGSTLTLDRGAVYIEGASAGEGVTVFTPLGSAQEIGTRFEVRAARDEMIVRVREGAVIVSGEGRRLEVREHQELTVHRGAEQRVTAVRPDASFWSWTSEASTGFAIEGRTLAQALEWISSETGLAIEYEDGELRRVAETTTLHGTLATTGAIPALETILPSAGMASIRRDGVLLITRASRSSP
jgi:hypothetical protein